MKKVFKTLLAVLFIVLIVFAVFNAYKFFTTGKQQITISMAKQAYTNSDFYVSIIAKKNGVDADNTKVKLKLLDNKGKKVKNVKITTENENTKISIPDIEPGKYTREALVSSSVGKDKIEKEIYVSK